MYTFGLWKTIPDSAVYWDNFSRNSFNIVEVHRIVVYSLALLKRSRILTSKCSGVYNRRCKGNGVFEQAGSKASFLFDPIPE